MPLHERPPPRNPLPTPLPPSRASKAALNAISTTLARDLAPSGVEVVAMHPGYVRTQLSGACACHWSGRGEWGQ